MEEVPFKKRQNLRKRMVRRRVVNERVDQETRYGQWEGNSRAQKRRSATDRIRITVETQGSESCYDTKVSSPESREQYQSGNPNWANIEQFYMELEIARIMDLAIDLTKFNQ